MSNAASRLIEVAARRASQRQSSLSARAGRFLTRYSSALAAGICGLVASTMLQRRNEFEERMSNANAQIERLQRVPEIMYEYAARDAEAFTQRLTAATRERQPEIAREWMLHAKKFALEEQQGKNHKETPQLV